jgi:polysaccharide biosynthesis/export protein
MFMPCFDGSAIFQPVQHLVAQGFIRKGRSMMSGGYGYSSMQGLWIGRMLFAALFWLLAASVASAQAPPGYRLGPGDVVRISVYNQPDLSIETQIKDTGQITFPLIGEVAIAGLDKAAAEVAIATRLRDGKFVKQPQVNLLVTQYRSQQVSVIGQVNKPGRYPIDAAASLIDLLAQAGGVNPTGADIISIIRKDNAGKSVRMEVDLNRLYETKDPAANLQMGADDIIFVPRAPTFYIYGEVQKPGVYKLERDMTVMQALSVGGGLTPRGTERGIRVNRRNNAGKVESAEVGLTQPLRENDVVVVRQSLF